MLRNRRGTRNGTLVGYELLLELGGAGRSTNQDNSRPFREDAN